MFKIKKIVLYLLLRAFKAKYACLSVIWLIPSSLENVRMTNILFILGLLTHVKQYNQSSQDEIRMQDN